MGVGSRSAVPISTRRGYRIWGDGRRALVRDEVWGLSVLTVALATMLLRLPFRSAIPFNWDAVQYILALKDFDVAAHQPHPPGNPLYVMLGRAVNLVIADPNQALIAVSIASSMAAVWGTALLGARLAGRRTGLLAAGLLVINPIFWMYGEVALAYAPEAAASVFFALAVWAAYTRPGWRTAIVLALVTAAAGGLRPTILPLLGPLWLFGQLHLTWKQRSAGVAVAGATSAVWLVPLVWDTGGPHDYWSQLDLLRQQAASLTALTVAPPEDWLTNLLSLLVASLVAMNALGLLALLALLSRLRRVARPSTRGVFLWLWVLPPLAMFSLVHFGQWGYLLMILPPAILLCLIELDATWLSRRTGQRLLAVYGTAAIVSLALTPTAIQLVRTQDTSWRRTEALVRQFPPAQTILLSELSQAGEFRRIGYLLPEYHVLGVGSDWSGDVGVMYEAAGGHSSFSLDPSLAACKDLRVSEVRYLIVVGQSLVEKLWTPTDWRAEPPPGEKEIIWREMVLGSASIVFDDSGVHVLDGAGGDDSGPACRVTPTSALARGGADGV